MSFEALRRARHVNAPITGTQHHVLYVLADHADELMNAWPSQSTLASICHRPRSVIQKALSDLEALGLIEREGAVRQVVRYRLCLPQPHATIDEQPDRPPVRSEPATRPPSGQVGAENQTAHRSGVSEAPHRPQVITSPPTGQDMTAHRSPPDRPPVTEASRSISEAPVKQKQQQLPPSGNTARPRLAPEPKPRRPGWAERKEATLRCRGSWRSQVVGQIMLSPAAQQDIDVAVADHGEAEVMASIDIVAQWARGRTTRNLRQLLLNRERERIPTAPAQARTPAPPPAPAVVTDDWRRVREALAAELNVKVFETYVAPLTGFIVEGGRGRRLGAPSDFIGDWVRENYAGAISAKIAEVLGDDGAVEIVGPVEVAA